MLLLIRRYWTLGGNHNREARYRICNEEFKGSWDKVRASKHYKDLAVTQCSICVGLTPYEAREVCYIMLFVLRGVSLLCYWYL